MTTTPDGSWTLPALRTYAEELGIDITGTKAQILAAIDAHERAVDDSDADEDAGILDVDDYDLPVVEDTTDSRFPAFIAGSTLIVRLEDPGEIQVPLKLTYKTLKEMKEGISPDADELDQLLFLLEKIGDDALLKTLTEDTDLADATAIAVLFFRAWKQRTGVSLGKLRSSSRR